jgi:SAM-dependent methyltransferase
MQKRRVPVDLLYVRHDGLDGNHSDAALVPIVCHRPLMSICRHVVNGTDSLDAYWDWAERQGSVLDRDAHLAEWKRKARWSRWTSSSPRPTIASIDRDRLLLASGVEQACLSKAVDSRWMWVDMPDEVASLWDRRSVDALNLVVRETGRKKFYNPVLHEEYRRARIVRPDSIRIDRIRRLFGPDGPGLRGLDIGCNMGYMAHMLHRHGVDMMGVDLAEGHLSVARALNITYGLDTKFVNSRFQQLEATADFPIVVFLTVMYHALNRSHNEAVGMIERIEQFGPSVLIWESGSDPALEIDLILKHSGLSAYLPLGQTRATGKDRELGVFVRPGTALSESLEARYKAELAAEFADTSAWPGEAGTKQVADMRQTGD